MLHAPRNGATERKAGFVSQIEPIRALRAVTITGDSHGWAEIAALRVPEINVHMLRSLAMTLVNRGARRRLAPAAEEILQERGGFLLADATIKLRRVMAGRLLEEAGTMLDGAALRIGRGPI